MARYTRNLSFSFIAREWWKPDGTACGLHFEPPGCILELDKYSEVDTWEGHGQQGQILSGKEEFKTTKRISDYNFKRWSAGTDQFFWKAGTELGAGSWSAVWRHQKQSNLDSNFFKESSSNYKNVKFQSDTGNSWGNSRILWVRR